MRRRRNLEVIAGSFNNVPVIVSGSDFTVVKITAGKFGVYLPQGFKIVAVSGMSNGFFYIPICQVMRENYFEIMISNTFGGGSLVDSGFIFVAHGTQQ